MAPINGKCTNFGNCPLADSNRNIAIQPGDPSICPACSHALSIQRSEPRRTITPLVALIVFIAAAGFVAVTFLRSSGAKNSRANASPVVATTGARPLLRLHGSNTIGAELGPALAKAYLESVGASGIQSRVSRTDEIEVTGTLDGQPVSIEIAAHGSATAFQDLASGSADIGMSSRAVKLEEESALAGLGDMSSPACEHVLGLDGIAMIVNESNPIDSLSKSELADIFSGSISNWNQIGASRHSTAGHITIYALDNRSGTFDSFKSLVLGNRSLATNAMRLEDSRKLVDSVGADASAIGFVGLPYVRGVKPLAISDSGTSPLLPNRLTVGTEDYPLSRRLYLYTAANSSNPQVRKFTQFAISKAGQDVVSRAGFITQNVAAETQAQPSSDAPAEYKKMVAGGRRLTLDFRFRSGSSDLDNKARVDLSRVAAFLADLNYSPNNVMLFGFADNQGGSTQNQQLSKTRAESVARQLRTAGVDPGVVLGFGSETPVASNDTPQGREKNRRVEIWVRK